MSTTIEHHQQPDTPRRRTVRAVRPPSPHPRLRSADADAPKFFTPASSRETSDTEWEPAEEMTAADHDDEKNDSRIAHSQEEIARQRSRRRQWRQEHRSTTSTAAAAATAHPFSRFLSAFSVAPEHPEHKRKIDQEKNRDNNHFDNDDDETNYYHEPDEKRIRYSGDDDDDDDDKNRKFMTRATIVVLVVAVVSTVVWRSRGRP